MNYQLLVIKCQLLITSKITITININIETYSIHSMNNVEIIKKRLKDLKQLSENLKQNTGNREQSQDNLNIVKAILNLTTDVNQKQNQTNTIAQSPPQLRRKITQELHQSVNKQTPNQNRLNTVVKKSQAQPETTTRVHESNQNNIEDTIRSLKQAHRQKQLQKRQAQIQHQHEQQQFQFLRAQNKKLKEENEILKQKVNALQQKIIGYENSEMKVRHSMDYLEIKSETAQHKNLSYFKLDESIGIFLTKLKITESDYDKVDYTLGQAVLHLQSIQVKSQLKLRESGRSRSSQQGEDRRKSIKPAKLDLLDLHKVQYFGSEVLILKFKDEQDQDKTLFLRFSDYEHLRKWDIGLYINYTLIKCLGKEKMFVGNFIFEEAEESQLIRMNSIHKKNQFEQELDKKVKDYTSAITSKMMLSQQQEEIVQEFYRLQFKLGKIQQRLKQKNLYGKLGLTASLASSKEYEGKYREQSVKQKPMMQMHKIKENKAFGKNQQILNEAQLRSREEQQKNIKAAKMQEQLRQRQKLFQAQQKRKEQFERELKEKNKREDYNQAKNILKKGMYMTKYAKGGINPHEKKVYLSTDQKKLCWRDKQNKQNNESDKYVLISEIKSINLGEVGSGIQKHVKTVTNQNCYATIHLTSDRPSLQFGMNVADLMQNFVDNLKNFVSYSKQAAIKIF